MKRLWIVLAATGLVFAVAVSHRLRSRTGAQLGSAARAVAPEFSVTTIDGKKLSLSEYRGRVVLLDFWATWCAPCREETPHFVQLQDKYRPYGFQMIGISMDDSAEPVRQFYRDFDMNYPVALGGASLGELYGGVFGLPIAFLINRDGHVVSKHIGGTDAAILDKEVADALRGKSGARP